MNETPSLYLLLVGIDKWINPILPPLDGCVNDIRLIGKLFRERYETPEENICVLLNEDATREAIETRFREHLVDNAKRFAHSDQKASPAFVFYYAGHGSRAADNSNVQSDGFDETIVPHDSRTENVFDIRDWELGRLIDELTEFTDNVTIFLDCCHAGSGTRDDELATKNRVCPPDMRPQPSYRPASVETGTRSADTSDERYVLIAACRSHEYAKEHTVMEDGAERKQGAMTYFLASILADTSSDRPMAYRELHERLRYEVNSRYASQMPQCEGDRDRLLFNGIRPPREPWMNVTKVEGETIWIDAGLTHGLTDGSLLSVFPPGTLRRQEQTAIGELAIAQAGAVQSRCQITSGVSELFSRVAIDRINFGNLLKTICLLRDELDESAYQEVAKHLGSNDASAYFQLIENPLAVDFTIQLIDGCWNVFDRSRTSLLPPIPRDDVDRLSRSLIGLTRYFNALKLRNHAVTSSLAGKVTLSMHAVSPELPTNIQTTSEGKPIRPVRELGPMLETNDGEPIVELGKPLAIGVTNHAEVPIYCEILNFSYDYEIRLLFQLFQGANKRIAPGATSWLGREGPLLQFQPPADPEQRQQFVEAREFLKVIATVDQTDFGLLQQASLLTPYSHRAGLDSALGELMHQAMTGGNHRALGPVKTSSEDDWTTVECEYLVRK